MNKEHLENDLTIKAFHKVGHIFTFDTPSNCSIYRPPESRCMREIDLENRCTNNFNALRALL